MIAIKLEAFSAGLMSLVFAKRILLSKCLNGVIVFGDAPSFGFCFLPRNDRERLLPCFGP